LPRADSGDEDILQGRYRSQRYEGYLVERIRLKFQIASAFLLNIGLVQWQFICFPVLNCHSCPTSVFACPLGVIGQFASIGAVPLTVIGGIALVGLLAGRVVCGWVCPFGLVQDLLYKVPYAKFSIPAWTRFIKYGVFIGLVVAVPVFLGTQFPVYFCRLCPVATIESSIPWALMQGTTNMWTLVIRLVILFAIIILVMGHRRFFCKVLCPLGACLSVFNRFAAVFPERSTDCIECSACQKICPMTVECSKEELGVFDNRPEECISCLECKEKCPTKSVHLWGC
ncbi:MAG: 4Fe-4S binding protein, partial [Pseudomonadota bacterium]